MISFLSLFHWCGSYARESSKKNFFCILSHCCYSIVSIFHFLFCLSNECIQPHRNRNITHDGVIYQSFEKETIFSFFWPFFAIGCDNYLWIPTLAQTTFSIFVLFVIVCQFEECETNSIFGKININTKPPMIYGAGKSWAQWNINAGIELQSLQSKSNNIKYLALWKWFEWH